MDQKPLVVNWSLSPGHDCCEAFVIAVASWPLTSKIFEWCQTGDNYNSLPSIVLCQSGSIWNGQTLLEVNWSLSWGHDCCEAFVIAVASWSLALKIFQWCQTGDNYNVLPNIVLCQLGSIWNGQILLEVNWSLSSAMTAVKHLWWKQ